MNKKTLTIIIYTSVFSTAYAGFFYQKHSVTMDGSVTDHHLTTSRPVAVINAKAAHVVANSEISSENDQLVATESLSPARNKQKRVKKLKEKSMGSRKATTRNTRSEFSPERASPYQTAHTYGSGNNESAEPAEYNRSSTLAYAVNLVTYPSAYEQTNIGSGITTSIPLTTTSSETGTIVSSPDTTFTESSDGSEFLPDGSSQQDLINSQSKSPRVYTIKDYQQADISCASGYGAPTAHDELIRGLKGC